MSRATNTSTIAQGQESASVQHGNVKIATSTVQSIGTKQDQQAVGKDVNRIMQVLKPYGPVIAAVVVKIATSKTTSQIVEEIRDKFMALSPWQKFFVILGAAALTATIGYFSWKIISGNWDRIMASIEEHGKEFQGKLEDGTVDVNNNIVVQKIGKMFEDGIEVPAVKFDANLVKKVIEPFTNSGFPEIVGIFINTLKNKLSIVPV